MAVFAAAALAIAGALFTGCAKEDAFIEYSLSRELYVDGQLLSSYEYAELSAEVGDLLAETESLFDAERAESDVGRINAAGAGEPVQVDARTYTLLELCKELYGETGGAFTPALYSLSELWGFTPSFRGRYSDPRVSPSQERISAALRHCDLSAITLAEDRCVIKTDAEAKLDLGGVAKGFMTDLVRQAVEARYAGCDAAYSVEVMSDLLLVGGKRDGELVRGYNVGISNPRLATTGAVDCLYMTGLEDVALSTSSDAYRSYVYEGEIFCHIIDPAEGAPSRNGVISITVMVPLSVPFAGARADAYSTAGFCMPLTEALSFYESLYAEYGVSCVVITQDWRYYTVGDAQVVNRSEYAAQNGLAAEDIFAQADRTTATDTVVRCEQEGSYIAYLTGLN